MNALRDPKGRRSPVGVAKALHLLCPDFFPIWDGEIASAYKCCWYSWEKAPHKYIEFINKNRRVLDGLLPDMKNSERKKAIKDICRECSVGDQEKFILKILDEYNYAKFTQEWI